MMKTFKLQPLRHLAKQKNDAAAKKLGQLNQNKQAAQSKLELLQQYRKDYQEKMQEAEQSGMNLQDLCNFRDFIYRLDDAIAQQNIVLSQASQSVQKGLVQLTETQRSVKSYDTLAQRHIDAEKMKETKMEQKIQDEHNGRRAHYQRSENNEE